MKFSDSFSDQTLTVIFEESDLVLSNSFKKSTLPLLGKELLKRIIFGNAKSQEFQTSGLSRLLNRSQYEIVRVNPTDRLGFLKLKKKAIQDAGKKIEDIPADTKKVIFEPKFISHGGAEMLRERKTDFLRELRDYLNFLLGNNKMPAVKYHEDLPEAQKIRESVKRKLGIDNGDLVVDKVNYLNNGLSITFKKIKK